MLTFKEHSPPFSAAANPFIRAPESNSPVNSNGANAPGIGFPYQDYLPASFSTSSYGPVLHVNQGNITTVLRRDMLVPKLEKVHMYLWWCERTPGTPPLHEKLMGNHEIVVTEDADLHLVCFSSRRRTLFKPLPRYLFCHEIWTSHICPDAELYMCCTGFLLSYAWRIRHESDLAIAIDHRLVPKELTWKAWTVFVSSFLGYIEANGGPSKFIHNRYRYGELKLTRLNIVCRYAPEVAGVRGYLSGYGQASMFFQRNFAWMGLGFLYLVAILTAMQVGLAAVPLRDNSSFNWACYAFAVFCILLPVTIVAVHLLRHLASLVWFSAGMMRKGDKTDELKTQSA